MPNTAVHDKPGLVILALDGGGVRGLSSLFILKECMSRLQRQLGLDQRPEPCEYFDIVGGTGTGGISATMLGRLRMPLDRAIEHFATLATKVFSDKKYFSTSGSSTFKSTKMQQALKDMIRETTGDENEKMLDNQNKIDGCKTVVFAMSRHNINAALPRAFRSYHAVNNQMSDCTIWEALSATTAHPDLFKSIDIGDGYLTESFVDGGLGCSNPLAHTLAEVKLLYPDRRVGCVVSIGAGHVRTIHIPSFSLFQSLLPSSVVETMKAIATDAEQEAQRMAVRFNSAAGVYFRMNVDQGMQSVEMTDWERLSEVMAHTRGYMQHREVSGAIDQLATAIGNRSGTIPVTGIDGELSVLPSRAEESGVKICPQPVPLFVGREQPIRQAVAYLRKVAGKRKIFIIHGLGGAGKTQMALRIVESTKELWSDIIFADATSAELMEMTLRDFAKLKLLGESHHDTLRWLASSPTRWLLVIDNADDPKLRLAEYLPDCSHGSILVTTRNQDLLELVLGEEAEYKASSLEHDEALQILLKATRQENAGLTEHELEAARGLLEDFGYLPLAIVQAGGYIRKHPCSFAHYRELYLRRPGQMMKKNWALQLNKSERAIFYTWELSYALLSLLAQQLLWILGCMQRDRIKVEIFRRAALHINRLDPAIPLSESEQNSLDFLQTFLSAFLDSNGDWDGDAFMSVLGEILSCSLMDYDRQNDVYVLHPLVQTWAQAAASDEAIGSHAANLVAASLAWSWGSEDYGFMRSLQLHVNATLQSTPAIPIDTAACLARVLHWNGSRDKAQVLQFQVLSSVKRVLGEGHLKTLAAMTCLAITYGDQGRSKEAEELQVRVLDASGRLLGEEHPHTLIAMNNLAITHADQGRSKEAEELQVRVLDASRRLLGEEHPNTLMAMQGLANTYGDQGRSKEAGELRVRVLDARRRLLGEEHPDTLMAMNNLAITYANQGRSKETEELRVRVLDARRRLLGEEHPDTLMAMQGLANTYGNQGRSKEAEELRVRVLDARRRLLGEEHPDTLDAMYNLAITFTNQGRLKQAEELQVRVVDARRRVLGEEHPKTLKAMKSLAITYKGLGRRYRGAYKTLKKEIEQLEARERSSNS